jgi:glycosyltransferase involved in cell wall biosynthesis
MRILIITGIFPPDIGGPATYVPCIADALSQQGHEVIVVTLSDQLDIPNTDYPFRVVRLARRQHRLWRCWRTVTTLVRLGRDADVLFVNGLALEAALANCILRKPLVLKVVGDLAWEQATNRGWVQDAFEDFQRNRYSLKVEMLRSLRTWWTRGAQRIIVPSRYLGRWVSTWSVPLEKLQVVYNAVDLPAKLSPCPTPLTTSIKVVTIGRLVRWKQMDKIIEAVGCCDGVGLVIIGDGPERERLTRLTHELHLDDRIYFAGQRSAADTLALLAACDLFVLNSTYEGLPHTVLEAIALGLPIIATAVGGVPEVVESGNNGQLIAATAPNALKETLARLLAQPLERQHLAEGARRTAKHFLFSRMVEETTAVLAETAAWSARGDGEKSALTREQRFLRHGNRTM